MKLVLCHSDPKIITRLLNRPVAGQNMLMPCHDANEAVVLIAATEPHLVVIGGDQLGVAPEELRDRLVQAGFRMPILILADQCPSDDQLDQVWRLLENSLRDLTAIQFDPLSYKVLTEPGLGHPAPRPPTSPAKGRLEENRFLALLAAGSLHQVRTASYLTAAVQTEARCQSDWALATLAGETAAYLWRNQLVRYLGVLAHYVPGVDVECLPLPHLPAATLDYLSATMSGEALYVLNALFSFGIAPDIESTLREVAQIEVTAGADLQENSARLAGWANFARVLAEAHVFVIREYLANKPERALALSATRSARNQSRTFCQFWKLQAFVDFPDKLERLANDYHAGRRAERVPEFDSFFDFAKKIQQQIQDEWGRN